MSWTCRCISGTLGRGVRLATLPGSDVPVYLLEHHQYLRSPLRLRSSRPGLQRQPRALRVPVPGLARADQGPGLGARHRPRQRLADRPAARLPEHGRVGQAAARRRPACSPCTTWPTRATRAAGAHFITGLGWEHFNPSEFEHFGDFNPAQGRPRPQLDAVDGEPDLRPGDPDLGVRLRPRRRAVRAQRRPARDPQRDRHRRPGIPARDPYPAGALRSTTTLASKAALQGRAPAGDGPARAARRPAVRRDQPADPAEGARHPGLQPRAPARLGSADRRARLGRSRGGALLHQHDRASRRQAALVHRVRRRPLAPDRGGRRLLPDAVALRALWPQPDVQPALRDPADRARHRRAGRHRA